MATSLSTAGFWTGIGAPVFPSALLRQQATQFKCCCMFITLARARSLALAAKSATFLSAISLTLPFSIIEYVLQESPSSRHHQNIQKEKDMESARNIRPSGDLGVSIGHIIPIRQTVAMDARVANDRKNRCFIQEEADVHSHPPFQTWQFRHPPNHNRLHHQRLTPCSGCTTSQPDLVGITYDSDRLADLCLYQELWCSIGCLQALQLQSTMEI